MDWKNLFFSANGRIGQKDFWIGFLILFVGGFVLGMIPLIGFVVSLVSIYCWICLYSKRLHDFGKSGWLQLIPFAIGIVATVIGFAAGGTSMLAAMANGNNDPAAAAAMIAGMGTIGAAMGVAGLVGLAFLLWVGLSKGDPAANQYGPPPGSAPAMA